MAEFVSGGGDVLAPAQQLEVTLILARALLLRLGGQVALDLDEVERAALQSDGELVAEKVNEYGKVVVHFRPWEARIHG